MHNVFEIDRNAITNLFESMLWKDNTNIILRRLLNMSDVSKFLSCTLQLY